MFNKYLKRWQHIESKDSECAQRNKTSYEVLNTSMFYSFK